MTKVFITGATGFVGGALLRECLSRGWEVRALVRPASDARNLEGHERGLERVNGDIHDSEALSAGMRGCDMVFHVAARYSLWNPQPAAVYRDNVDGTRRVLEAAARSGATRIVYTSTVGVLKAPADGRPADEAATASLREVRGHYKRSKWLADECAREMAAKGVPVVIVNPTAPVGPHDIKPTPTGSMILDFLKRKLRACTDTGLNLVSVEDVAKGHILAAERGVPGERYILGAENYSFRRILDVLASLTGLPTPRFSIPRRLLLPLGAVSSGASLLTGRAPLIPWEAARMAQTHMYFDSMKAQQALGYQPGDVRQALARAIRWFLDNGYASLHPVEAKVLEKMPQ